MHVSQPNYSLKAAWTSQWPLGWLKQLWGNNWDGDATSIYRQPAVKLDVLFRLTDRGNYYFYIFGEKKPLSNIVVCMTFTWLTSYQKGHEKPKWHLNGFSRPNPSTMIFILLPGAVTKWCQPFFDIFDPSLPLVTHYTK